jgi:hypothetical protein
MKTFVPTTEAITADEVCSWFLDDERIPHERAALVAQCLNDCRNPEWYPARPPYLRTERYLARQWKAEAARLKSSPHVAEDNIAELERRIACLQRPQTRRRNAFTRAWTHWAPIILTLFYDILVSVGRTPLDAEIEARPLTRNAVRRVYGPLTDEAIDRELRKLPPEYLSGPSQIFIRRGKQQ